MVPGHSAITPLTCQEMESTLNNVDCMRCARSKIIKHHINTYLHQNVLSLALPLLHGYGPSE